MNHQILSGPIFFYCSGDGFPHLSICLAEGLNELGIPFYSNINYWYIDENQEKTLFRYDTNVTPDDCSVVIIDKNWFFLHSQVPENLFHQNRQYLTVYLDDMDGPKPSMSSELNFDFVLRTHFVQPNDFSKNFHPWCFGLSNRILKETENVLNFLDKKNQLMVNYRTHQEILYVSHWWLVKVPHGLLRLNSGLLQADYPIRKLADQNFLPLIEKIMNVERTMDSFEQEPTEKYDYLQWTQTGKRHHPSYYQRLKESVACAAFGGWLVPFSNSQEKIAQWWDSWRFWESLAAGCVAFHVDFDKYGIQLPVMPENWRHYIGIDLDNIESTIQRLIDEPDILQKISNEGRQWAIENYSPVPTALRFLEIIGKVNNFNGFGSLVLELTEINLIIFPNWSASEDELSEELGLLLESLLEHKDREKITLLIETSAITEEDANLFLAGVTMNLMMSQDVDITDELSIAIVGEMTEIQWSALLPKLSGRIPLTNENKKIIERVKAQTLPLWY